MNYETNKIIFICYPPGAGGKFLINCLGLSDSAVLQHQNYINFTKEQKQKRIYVSTLAQLLQDNTHKRNTYRKEDGTTGSRHNTPSSVRSPVLPDPYTKPFDDIPPPPGQPPPSAPGDHDQTNDTIMFI